MKLKSELPLLASPIKRTGRRATVVALVGGYAPCLP